MTGTTTTSATIGVLAATAALRQRLRTPLGDSLLLEHGEVTSDFYRECLSLERVARKAGVTIPPRYTISHNELTTIAAATGHTWEDFAD